MSRLPKVLLGLLSAIFAFVTVTAPTASASALLPATGEEQTKWIIIAAVVLLIIGGLIIFRRKK